MIGKEIEKACHGVYPLQNVYIRKVKMLKKPKFDRKPLLALFNRTRTLRGSSLCTLCCARSDVDRSFRETHSHHAPAPIHTAPIHTAPIHTLCHSQLPSFSMPTVTPAPRSTPVLRSPLPPMLAMRLVLMLRRRPPSVLSREGHPMQWPLLRV